MEISLISNQTIKQYTVYNYTVLCHGTFELYKKMLILFIFVYFIIFFVYIYVDLHIYTFICVCIYLYKSEILKILDNKH